MSLPPKSDLDQAEALSVELASILTDPEVKKGLDLDLPMFLAEGDPLRVVYASAAALCLYGAVDKQQLTQHLFENDERAGERLKHLAKTMSPTASWRLERSRLAARSPGAVITLMCRNLVADSKNVYFLVIALGAKPAPSSSHRDASSHLLSQLNPTAVKPHAPDAALPPHAAEKSALESATEAASEPLHAPSAWGSFQSVELVPPTLPDLSAQPSRFVWRSDAHGHLLDFTPELALLWRSHGCELFGPSLLERTDLFVHAIPVDLEAALQTQRTFNGVVTQWRLETLSVPIRIAGAPLFNPMGECLGFRGFGTIQWQEAAPLDPQVLAEKQPLDIRPPHEQPVEAQLQKELLLLPHNPKSTELQSQPEAPVMHADVESREIEQNREQARPEADMLSQPEPPPIFAAKSEPPVFKALIKEPISAKVVQFRPQAIVPKLGASEPPVIEPPVIEASVIEPSEIDSPAIGTQGFELPRGQLPVEEATEAILPTCEPTLDQNERRNFSEIARSLKAHLKHGNPSQIQVLDGTAQNAQALSPLKELPAPEKIEALPPPKSEPAAPPASGFSETPVFAHADLTQAEPTLSYEPAAPQPAATKATTGAVIPDMADILQRLSDGVLVIRENKSLFVNDVLLDWLGFETAAQFEDEQNFEHLFAASVLEQPHESKFLLHDRQGRNIAVDASMQLVEWNGAPASLIVFHKQTQEPQKAELIAGDLFRAEAEVRELRAILDTATDGVAVLDDNGIVRALNRSGEALFGYDHQEVIGEPFTFLLARESHALADEYLQGLKQNGVASVLNDGREVIGRARKGGAIPLFMTMGRLGPGASAKFCAVLRDLTQWKKAERELSEARKHAEQASAHKSDFLAKVSHEIRTPLNAILGFAEVILEERFGPLNNQRYKDYLRDIHASGAHVMSLVNDLLDLSKIEAGRMELEFSGVDANKVIAECVSLMQPEAARSRIVVRQSLAAQMPQVVADERSLRQITLNLMSNAFKFNMPGGQVIISTALTDAGYAVIRFRDTGIGMSESEIELAMEPFRQLKVSQRAIGTGLGLPLTKALVEANRASFTIKSRKNEGTLVEIAFPPTRVLAE